MLGIVRHPGAFQEYFTLPEENLLVVADKVRTEHAVFTEPVAAACEILDQVKIAKSQPVAVLGDGKLGLLIAQVLAAHGAEVHQFGRHIRKLAIAREAGVRTTVIPGPSARFDIVVEATGSSAGLAEAVRMVRPRGTIVMKSTVHDKLQVDTAPIVVNEITLVGSRCGRFQPALKLITAGKLNLDPMIDSRYALRDAESAFARAASKGALKVLLHV